MKKQIIRVAPVQTAKVFALLYFVMSLPIALIIIIITAFIPGKGSEAGYVIILMPFVYLIAGFVFTSIGCAIYNFVTRFAGGIEYTTVTVDEEQ